MSLPGHVDLRRQLLQYMGPSSSSNASMFSPSPSLSHSRSWSSSSSSVGAPTRSHLSSPSLDSFGGPDDVSFFPNLAPGRPDEFDLFVSSAILASRMSSPTWLDGSCWHICIVAGAAGARWNSVAAGRVHAGGFCVRPSQCNILWLTLT